MGIAVVAHRRVAGVSECAWYLCVYLMDATLGITTAILLHKVRPRLPARLPAAARARGAVGNVMSACACGGVRGE